MKFIKFFTLAVSVMGINLASAKMNKAAMDRVIQIDNAEVTEHHNAINEEYDQVNSDTDSQNNQHTYESPHDAFLARQRRG